MTALESGQRKQLEGAVIRAREVAEAGARATLQTLAVDKPDAFPTMSQDQRDQRTALRAKAKNLGEGSREAGYAPLVEEIAYEQWHRLLFARFLAENGLLIHPEYDAPLSIDECAEEASSQGADNGWDLAGRYAACMLPGIFRPGDPAAQVRLAREHRAQLEALVAGLPEEVFTSDDGLGWTYQFWQAKRKNEVNASGVKIGARELAPVTQLFTEDYMVRFLLENSLGAWWAARHPESPLLAEMAYLRFTDDGAPAAGTFPGWPETTAEATVMDPCCGSGHFLVRAFHLLRQMRMEEEGLDAAAAGDAVLRDNLFGLELDERCVQIAAFAVALEAWKSGGYRALPAPQVACSGVPVAGQLDDWLKLAGDDVNLRETLRELYRVFEDAPVLGSLIDPRLVLKSQQMFAPKLSDVEHAISQLQTLKDGGSKSFEFLGEVVAAGSLLTSEYTLVVTNPPFLSKGMHSPSLGEYIERHFSDAKGDLATAFLERCIQFSTIGGSVAVVTPTKWWFLGAYKKLRHSMLVNRSLKVIVDLGFGAFQTPMWDLGVALNIISEAEALGGAHIYALDASEGRVAGFKSSVLQVANPRFISQADQLTHPDSRIVIGDLATAPMLRETAESRYGLRTGDKERFIRRFWEHPVVPPGWVRHLSTVKATTTYGGREHILFWADGQGPLRELAASGVASIQGQDAWGKDGVLISLMGNLPATIYKGEKYDNNVAPIWTRDSNHLPALWAYCSSQDYAPEVRKIDSAIKLMSATLLKVPFDLEHWQKVAAEKYPNGLPAPHSDDPSQWLFNGHPKGSEAPLQVAVARLLGYRWPEQPVSDGLEAFADTDGIVPLTSMHGETPAAERLRALLAAAYGDDWSPAVQERLLAEVGFAGRDLAAWLADGKGFFAQHAKLFHNRPFIWHIWDGARDGFSVLVNYHTLTQGNLERLTYTYLGDWITRQEGARKAGDVSVEGRLDAARKLKAKLELILAGERPYDVYVRWKPLHEQPIGWDPDLNDGVRLNIRPFIEAGILRAKFSVNWKKDRGDNPPGSTARAYAAAAQQAATNSKDLPSTDGRERFNDLHLTTGVKEAARAAHQAAALAGGDA